MEIMVVLLLFSMLLGLGVGAFSKIGGGPTVAVGRIKDVVRSARYQAVRERAESAVRIDPRTNGISGLGWRNVGCWHFEDDRQGFSTGFPADAALGRGALDPEGMIGRCLRLAEDPSPDAPAVSIPSRPSLEGVQGVGVDCFLFLDRAGRQEILSKGESFRFEVSEEGLLSAALSLRPANASGPVEAARISLESDGYIVPAGRWVEVGFRFNGYGFVLVAEGIPRAREDFPRRMELLVQEGVPIEVGGRTHPLAGRIDELHLSAAVVGEEIPFQESVQLLGKEPYQVFFDARGFLDPERHPRPVEVVFTYRGGRTYRVVIGVMGDVR